MWFHLRRSWGLMSLVLLVLGSSPARADTCAVVHELVDLYGTMDLAYQNGGRVDAGTARELQIAAHRLNPAILEPLLEETQIGDRAATVLAPLTVFRRAELTRVGEAVIFSDLDRMANGRALARAISELGRLDCPRATAPVRPARKDVLWDPAVPSGNGGHLRYGGGGAAFLAMIALIGGLVWNRDRQTRLKQRFVCSIPVTLPGGIAAVAIDLSREGIKVAVPGGKMPTAGTSFTVRIGERTLSGTVRWCNVHVFGGQLEGRLTRAELAAMLALSETDRGRQKRSPRNRTGAPAAKGDGADASQVAQ